MSRITRVFSILALISLISSPISAQTRDAADMPNPSTVLAGFGADVVIDGNTILVARTGLSAMFPEPASQMGGLHIFARSNSGWAEQYSVTPEGAEMDEDFGRSMAMSGSTLFVGAPKANEATGKVYVMTKTGGTWQNSGVIELPDGQPGDSLGHRMMASGNTLFVSTAGTQTIHVFERDGQRWSQVTQISAPEDSEASGLFPRGMAAGGPFLVVGEPGHETGRVHVYRRDGTDWNHLNSYSNEDAAGSFGTAITSHGPHIMIGAPGNNGDPSSRGAVFEYTADPVTGELTRTEWLASTDTVPDDNLPFSRAFGFGADVEMNGNEMWVFAPLGGTEFSGSVHVYQFAGASWDFVEELSNEGLQRFSGNGGRIAVSGNVGVRTNPPADFGEGTAIVYNRTGNSWETEGRLVDGGNGLLATTGDIVPCEGGMAGEFACDQVEMQSFLPISAVGGERGDIVNDLWGWVDSETQREYAIVGRSFGTAFVDVTDPTNPIYLGNLPAHEGSTPNAWRDVKVFRHYAFIVADNTGPHGMQIFDLHNLRGLRNTPVEFEETAHYDRINSAHNIIVNEEAGFAYAVGASSGGETCGGGLHMIDVRDPLDPKFAGCFNDPNTGNGSGASHDAQCVIYNGPDARYAGREICLGSNGTALSIADVTDKDNPVPVAVGPYPGVSYAHQGWLTDDHRYFYMNDEGDEVSGITEGTRTIVWDLEELDDPVVANMFIGTTDASDHNLYVSGDYMYQSNYVAGLRIIDISDRENPREVGFFDTVPWGENAPGFAGSWTNYPFFESGTILVSSIKEGLFILKKREELTP